MNEGQDYERAFAAWLNENQMPYRAVDQSRRRQFRRHKIKSFDFAVSTPGGLLLADVKGRLFRGQSLVGLKGLQTWVTGEDIEGLLEWRQAVAQRQTCQAGFVFAYRLTQVDVESDGLSVFEFEGQRYVFVLIELDRYRNNMKRRSLRWNTVYLPARQFRSAAVPLTNWMDRHSDVVVNEINTQRV
ncbi:HYExAFE family protein [Anaerohalosphaeraceae bacterium U12dextr]